MDHSYYHLLVIVLNLEYDRVTKIETASRRIEISVITEISLSLRCQIFLIQKV